MSPKPWLNYLSIVLNDDVSSMTSKFYYTLLPHRILFKIQQMSTAEQVVLTKLIC